MTPDILGAIIQGGAVALLAFVLWQVSMKIDTAMANMQALLIKMLDMLDKTERSARQASIKSDRNFQAINEARKD